MSSLRKAVIDGVNEFLAAQRALPDPCHVQIIGFSSPDDYATIASGDVRNIADFNLDTYHPTGTSTAFYDAAIRAIDGVGMALFHMPEVTRPANVLFYMVTDGLNNAFVDETPSRGYFNASALPDYAMKVTQRINTLKSRIEHQQSKYNWKFLYLGTNQDAITAAQAFGLHQNQAINYNASYGGTTGMLRMAATKAASYRSGNIAAMDVTDDDRNELNNAK